MTSEFGRGYATCLRQFVTDRLLGLSPSDGDYHCIERLAQVLSQDAGVRG